MAIIIGGLLGSSRNKVGSLVYYRSKGQDIARSLAANITNPRSTAQMSQRIKLANLVNAYKANAAWMARYAFSRRPTKWSVYNAFVSANINGNTPYLTKSEAAAGCAIVSPYKFTDGTIPSIVHSQFDGQNGLTDLYLGAGFTIDENTTTGAFSEAILENNNGVQAGWQLSLIINYQQSNGNTYYILPRYYEVTLAVGDTTTLGDRLPLDHIAAVANSAATNTQLAYVAGAGDAVAGYMFCLSKKTGGVVDVSSQYMVLTNLTLYQSYTSATQAAAAAASYGSSETAFLQPGYGGSGGSDSSVTIPNSILRVTLNERTVNVGEYLGAYGGEDAGTLVITFNSDVVEASVDRVNIVAGTSTAYTEGITYNGAAITVAIPAGFGPNPVDPITQISVQFGTYGIIAANFARSQGTGGDVEE